MVAGCAASQAADQVETSASYTMQDYSVVTVTKDPSLVTRIELPLPPNPYADDDCACACEVKCPGKKEMGEFTSLVSKLKLDATKRADAAADAILAQGSEIVHHEGWKDIVTSTMELLANPTIVIVPVPGGKLKKVSLEKLGQVDLPASQIVGIKNSVGGKMESAIRASMIAHGMPEAEARKVAAAIVKTYMKKMLAP